MIKSEWCKAEIPYSGDVSVELSLKVKKDGETIYSVKWDSPTLMELVKASWKMLRAWWDSKHNK